MNRSFIRIQSISHTARPWFFIFSPGIMLMLVGLAALIAPRLFLALIAGLFLFGGVLFCVVAWKLVALKRNMESFIKTRLHVQRGPITFETFATRDGAEDQPERKIVFH